MKYRLRFGRLTIPVKSVLMAVFFAFFALKMLRAFSGSSVQGGIWNYIQLFFVALGALLFVIGIWRYRGDTMVMLLFLYTAIAMLNAMFSAQLSRTWIFQYLTVAYPFAILVIAIEIGRVSKIEDNVLLVGVFLIMAAIFVLSMARNGAYSTKTGAVADVYYVLGLLPLMMICFRKNKAIPLIVCGIAVIVSGKRTGIIVYAGTVFAYFLILSIQSRRVSTYLKSILLMVVFVAGFLFVLDRINTTFNTHLLLRLSRIISENDSSGRYERWKQITQSLDSASLWRWITGFGQSAVAHRFGGNAHNDFLEILYDYGVFALLGYALFYVVMAVNMLRMLKDGYEYTAQFIMSILLCLGLANFSFYAIAPTYITAGMLCVGCIWADYRKRLGADAAAAALEE